VSEIKISEYQHQVALFQWIAAAKLSKKPNFWKLKFAHCSLSGVKLSMGQAVKVKRSGAIRGVPDVFLPIPVGERHGLYIEMKTKGGKVSPEQNEFLEYAMEVGYVSAVCFSAKEAIELIEKYLQGDFS